jgi:hypothetical protein
MVPTPGERRESCARYADCLTAHVAAHSLSKRGDKRDPPASCPSPCKWYGPNGERATDYAVSKRGNMEVP